MIKPTRVRPNDGSASGAVVTATAGIIAGIRSAKTNVRFTPDSDRKADMCGATSDVRY